jgi:MFS family permease
MIFCVAITLFELGSLVCATSHTSTIFIIGRSIQGLGAGGIFAGSITIIGFSVPLRSRPVYFSLIGAMFAVLSNSILLTRLPC